MGWTASLLTLQILATIGHALALVTSVFRLTHRIRIRKFWWDDLLALLSSLLIAALLVMLWLQTAYYYYYTTDTKQQQIFSAWFTPLVFNVVVWTTRISICYSVTRILSEGIARRISVIMIILFSLSCCGIFAGKIWLCSHDSSWHDLPFPTCPQNPQLSTVQIIADVLSSVSLVVFPIYVLWNVDLPPIERRLILGLFAASILITALASLHSAYAFSASGAALFGYTGHLEAGISLTVCNLLVVGTRFYRFLNHERDDLISVPTPAGLELTRQTVAFTEISQLHYDSFSSTAQFTVPDSSYYEGTKPCTEASIMH